MHAFRLGWAGVAAIVGTVTVSAAALGALNQTPDRSAQDAAAFGQSATDPHAMSRSYGIDPSSSRPAFSDVFGRRVAVGRSAQGACLLQQGGDTCRTATQIDAGQGTLVQADCSTTSGATHRLQIMGLVPINTSKVLVGYSDGTQRTALSADGAYLMVDAMPLKGQPYPVTLDWADTTGKISHKGPFPFDGQDLCIPVP